MTEVQITHTLVDAFAAVVARHPDKVFFATPERTLTVAEFDRLSNRVAHTIPMSPDRRAVAVLCDDPAEFQAAQVGLLKAGRPIVRIHTDEPPARQSLVLDECGADTLIVSAGQVVDPLLAGRSVVRMSDLSADETPVHAEVRPDDIALLMHTSGSTGIPKGMAHSYGSLHARSWGFIRALDLSPDDRIMLISRLGTLEIGSALVTGASVHPYDLRARGISGIGDWMRGQRITTLRTPPSVMRSIAPEVGEGPFPDLRIVAQAGERLTPRDVDLIRSTFGAHVPVLHFYGTSESGVVTTHLIDPTFDTAVTTLPAGLPAPGVTVTIEDEHGKPVPAGEPGRIIVQSPALVLGYYGRDDLTADRFSGEGPSRRFASGDIGRWNEDGLLEFVGRLDDQVKVAGNRVEIAEVEEALRHVDGIDEAAVAPRTEADGSTTLVAYFTHGDPSPRIADLRRAVARRLPAYMVPTRWVPMERFARALPTDKIDRQALPDPPPRPDVGDGTAAGRLAALWIELLGVADVQDDDSFFDLGGDSLAASALVAAVDEEFACRIEMADLFGDDTFGSMVAAVEAAQGVVPTGPLFALKRSGDLPPLFCIHMPGWKRLRYLVLSRAIGGRRPMVGVIDDDTPALPKRSSLGRIADRYAASIRQSFDGPYLLLGHSAAGTLAFEIGRRLSDAGGEVAFVGVVDSPYPGSRPGPGARLRAAITRHGILGVAKIAAARGLRRAGLRGHPAASPRTAPRSVRKRLRMVHALHPMVPADLPVTYFRATETRQAMHHVRDWRRLGARVVDIPGKHGTILKANRIDELSRRLEEAMG